MCYLLMLEIRRSNRTKIDIKSIWRYSYNEWGEVQADRYVAKLNKAIERLAKTPRIGAPRESIRSGLRAYHVGRHVIYYYVEPDHLYIVRIRHDRSDPYLYEE